jgi:hypothetical protein
MDVVPRLCDVFRHFQELKVTVFLTEIQYNYYVHRAVSTPGEAGRRALAAPGKPLHDYFNCIFYTN